MLSLQVRFEKPGFFLNDPRLEVRLGDRKVYDGSFAAGFDVSVSVPPGRHVLETRIHGPMGTARRQQIELMLNAEGGYRDAAAVCAELKYSRLSGNFKRRADLSIRR